jgi:small-conductance mechanosensitive channel
MGARTYRRISTMVSITYDTTPGKIEAFCEGIRGLIRNHPYTRKDYFHVWLNQFSSSSLDIILYCFLVTPDWSTELRERHRLFLDIIRLAHDLGIEFAFPTQTIFMGKEQPVPGVFPASGTIKSVVDKGNLDARNRAVEITESELGGKRVIPTPVSFGEEGSTAGVEGE